MYAVRLCHFVTEGRYRSEHIVHVWAGIRVIVHGAHRLVLVLPHTSAVSALLSGTVAL
jgi:hypothetical protein